MTQSVQVIPDGPSSLEAHFSKTQPTEQVAKGYLFNIKSASQLSGKMDGVAAFGINRFCVLCFRGISLEQWGRTYGMCVPQLAVCSLKGSPCLARVTSLR